MDVFGDSIGKINHMKSEPTQTISTFGQEVLEGLSKTPKELPTKYIYDEEGDVLFQKIMELPEYYLTRAEFEIFTFNKSDIAKQMASRGPFRLVELGAGDGVKTKIIIRELLEQNIEFTYVPVDISAHVLEELSANFKSEFPELNMAPMAADYFEALENLKSDQQPMVVMFLGSNLGNFESDGISQILAKISGFQNPGDGLFLGVDLMKDPKTILAAYNDSQGVTAAFNKNLLVRMNKELGADFDPDEFYFYPNYDPVLGGVRSYLVSARAQDVHFSELEETVSFARGEAIFTEVSQKFSREMLADYRDAAGFEYAAEWKDCTHGYVNLLWRKNG
jgi:dimethylhistidine N-methyltransferase